jgi:hypothetical protein
MLYKQISELTQEDMEQITSREVEFFKVMDDVSVIINEVKKRLSEKCQNSNALKYCFK